MLGKAWESLTYTLGEKVIHQHSQQKQKIILQSEFGEKMTWMVTNNYISLLRSKHFPFMKAFNPQSSEKYIQISFTIQI